MSSMMKNLGILSNLYMKLISFRKNTFMNRYRQSCSMLSPMLLARGVLPQQSCGKRKSISRDISPSSGGAEVDIGSNDLDVEAYT
jgi:hypothetical protein